MAINANEVSPFRVEVEYVERRAVVIVAGEVDLATAPILLRTARSTLSIPVDGIAVDLGQVTFLDSSGIHALLTLRREATERQIAFTLTAVARQARRVLEITGLTDMFGLRSSESA